MTVATGGVAAGASGTPTHTTIVTGPTAGAREYAIHAVLAAQPAVATAVKTPLGGTLAACATMLPG